MAGLKSPSRSSVLILGDGRIARAVAALVRSLSCVRRVAFFSPSQHVGDFDLLIGALPGELGQQGVRLALEFGKDLLDISDVDPPFYLRHRRAIDKAGITVIPGCGFSPGLVNALLGYELSRQAAVKSVEIKAGSLSRTKDYFPFLWCFEDLVLEHRIPSWQLVDGKQKRFRAFAGWQGERFLGIPAESYYCASGFENLLKKFPLRTFTTRVIRPRGFRAFFAYLNNYGFFSKARLPETKRVLEAVRRDNYTLATVSLRGREGQTCWSLQSFSRRQEPLNSMQKMTAALPTVIAEMVLSGALRRQGLLFMDEVALLPGLLPRLLSGVRRRGVSLKRQKRC